MACARPQPWTWSVDVPLQIQAQKDTIEATPLPKHTISTISQYTPSTWYNSSQWEAHAAWPRLTDSRERLGKSESGAASMEVGATRWMLLRVMVVVVP